MNDKIMNPKISRYVASNEDGVFGVRRKVVNKKTSLMSRTSYVIYKALKKKLPDDLHIPCGCTVLDIRNHMERQFVDGMNWTNYGRAWEMDHIKPRSSFSDHNDPEQVADCHHYTNLRPLRPIQNVMRRFEQEPS